MGAARRRPHLVLARVLTCVRVSLSRYRRAIPDFRYDLHYAARVIRRHPGYAVAAMLCLALGTASIPRSLASWTECIFGCFRFPVRIA